jgi:hypothetical protein
MELRQRAHAAAILSSLCPFFGLERPTLFRNHGAFNLTAGRGSRCSLCCLAQLFCSRSLALRFRHSERAARISLNGVLSFATLSVLFAGTDTAHWVGVSCPYFIFTQGRTGYWCNQRGSTFAVVSGRPVTTPSNARRRSCRNTGSRTTPTSLRRFATRLGTPLP